MSRQLLTFSLLTKLNPEVKMKIRIVARRRWTVYAVCTERGDCPVQSFLLEDVTVTPTGLVPRNEVGAQKIRMGDRLAALAKDGPQKRTEVCHLIERDLWQLESGRIRILWFYGSLRTVVLAHGFLKTTPKTPDRARRVAREALSRYQEARRTGNLFTLED